MKICPNCKNEYRDEITHCADCDCELIEVVPEQEERVAVATAPYPIAMKAKEYLEYCKFREIIADEPDEEGMVRIFCLKKDYQEVLKQAQVFMVEEAKKIAQEKLASMSEEELEAIKEEESKKVFVPSNRYQNYEEKAAENKSSAISFLLVGIGGAIVVALSWFGKLPFSIGGSGNWFTHGVMFLFFVIFAIIGIISAKNIKHYAALASEEADTQSELEAYIKENFTLESLSAIKADTDEEAYFKRMSYMREQMKKHFSEDESFVETLLDEHYDRVFG